jgi:glutaminyl-tRNA synthetase
MYERAIVLIKKGLAYVDHSSADEIAKDRGNVNLLVLNQNIEM